MASAQLQDLGEISGSYKADRGRLGYKAIVGAGSTIYINDVGACKRGKTEL